MEICSRDWQEMLDQLKRIATALEKQAAQGDLDAQAEKIAQDLNKTTATLTGALPGTPSP